MNKPFPRRTREQVFPGDRGEVRIWFAGPRVMVFQYVGHVTVMMGDFVIRVADAEISKGERLDFFVDLEGITSYEPAFRQRITEWGSRVRLRVGKWAFLVRSQLVSMAISVTSLFISNLESFTSRIQFEHAIDKAVRAQLGASTRMEP